MNSNVIHVILRDQILNSLSSGNMSDCDVMIDVNI